MSDVREQAEIDLTYANMPSDLTDSLASAFDSSFTLPPPAPAERESASIMAAVAAAERDTAPLPDEPAVDAAVPGMAEWKDTYEGYVKDWHQESAIAREKALNTRVAIEKQRNEEEKRAQDAVKADKNSEQARIKAARDAHRLSTELEGRDRTSSSHCAKEDRERRVKEAWEMIKSAPEGGEPGQIPVDARGVTPADLAAGQAIPGGQRRGPPQKTAYDPTTSTDPLPPSMKEEFSSSSGFPAPTDSTTVSRHSATSGAWEELSGSPSSKSGSGSDDLVQVPHPDRDHPAASQQPPGSPAVPPSLTLSLFTAPSHLSASRIIAVLGINLVLPFVNGVMLGFGEIFAREIIRVGKVWWREGGNFYTVLSGRSDNSLGGNRGVASVGLSGSGGFP